MTATKGCIRPLWPAYLLYVAQNGFWANTFRKHEEDVMASGWASDGAVQEQIESTVNDEIARVRGTMSKGESAEFCDECGEPIPQARREAVPGVRFCLACQQAHDKQLKGSALYNRRGSKDSQLR